MEGERRGSVTALLQQAPEYYTPPSPGDYPEPEADCWDDLRPRQRKAQKRRTSEAKAKKEESDEAAEGAAAKKKEKDKGAGKKVAPSPAALLGQKKGPAEAKKEDGGKGKSKKAAKNGRKQGEQADGDENGQGNPPPQPVFMRGCSSAYQKAVEQVRGTAVVASIVVLGLPADSGRGKDMRKLLSSSQMDTSSFVAVAASRMRMKGAKEEEDPAEFAALPKELKKQEKPRQGKKLFEDAYINTWSHSILPADESLFAITFNTTEKQPTRTPPRLSKQKSVDERTEMNPTEWLDWRSVHDRVDEWLKENCRAEADESHLVALLQDLDPKKGHFFR
ncbi:uncharacterized protein LOC125035029 [Penaeus chinensis]|uniref:uncharacterized protein LOC125035029 n=1 Tax=Penaeus chinensis TaxID=139456 RepID=UPI001FB5DE6C|nr:uncharacterized protein LOC125035029 [Penaeus chinensis]